MNPLSWLRKKLDIPAPEVHRFGPHFHHLFLDQIEYILNVINEEVKRSKKFGLVLRPEDILKEKMVFLALIDKCGGVIALHHLLNQDYEDTWHKALAIIAELLANELKYYWDSNSVLLSSKKQVSMSLRGNFGTNLGRSLQQDAPRIIGWFLVGTGLFI